MPEFQQLKIGIWRIENCTHSQGASVEGERESSSTRPAPIFIQLHGDDASRRVVDASAYGSNPIIVVDIDLIIYITSDACHEIIAILAMGQLDSTAAQRNNGTGEWALRVCAPLTIICWGPFFFYYSYRDL